MHLPTVALALGLALVPCSARTTCAPVPCDAWLRETAWEQLADMSAPAPIVPEPLDDDDMDKTLFELTQRCQSGFD